jgi:hypothetical protein
MNELLEEDKEMIIEILRAYCFTVTNRFFGSYNQATPEETLLKLYKAYEKVPRIDEIIKILKGEK